MNQSSVSSSIEAVSLRINEFSRDIEACFQQADWEKLAVVLSSRHLYLEQVLGLPAGEENRQALANLVERILAQDGEALEKIQNQQQKLLASQLLLEQGQRAVKAYRTL